MCLVLELQALQKKVLLKQRCFFAASVLLASLVAAGLLGNAYALWVLLLGALAAAALVLEGWFSKCDERHIARLIAAKEPALNLDILAAVELSSAIEGSHDFSLELAHAFLQRVDGSAAQIAASSLVDTRPAKRASGVLFTTVAVAAVLVVFHGAALQRGIAAAFMASESPRQRESIIGEVELLYRYPAHVGRAPLSVPGSTGDVSAPAGTEVSLKTRAMHEVEAAALIVNDTRVPLRVSGRDLDGSFVLRQPGQYHVVFLQDSTVVRLGFNRSITIEADEAPQVRVSAPIDGLELDPDKQEVVVKYEVTDDYGLSSLQLKYRFPSTSEKSITLTPGDGRITRGSYVWNLAPLSLKPGQILSYRLEAHDNDAVAGHKAGTSRTLTLKVYSAAEHRRVALHHTQALWERLIRHLADRMEGKDRYSSAALQAIAGATSVDERGIYLAQDMAHQAQDFETLRDAPKELSAALWNVSQRLRKDVEAVALQRSILLASRNNSVKRRTGQKLAAALSTDISTSEADVLYLEALLDRQRLHAVKELAQALKADRTDLFRLMEDYARTHDAETRRELQKQTARLHQRMNELQRRMLAMMKGIRDEFMNREALEQLVSEQSLFRTLNEVERLLKANKVEEAMKKLQFLAMQMDELLEALNATENVADEQVDPELDGLMQDFQHRLYSTLEGQRTLAQETRALRDKYRKQQAGHVARRGANLKRQLHKALRQLEKNYLQYNRFVETLMGVRSGIRHVQRALEANDFDLANDAAQHLSKEAQALVYRAQAEHHLHELTQSAPETRRASEALYKSLQRDAKKARGIAESLKGLFSQEGLSMSQPDKQKSYALGRRQKRLNQMGERLQQQMQHIDERAPVFNNDAQAQMERIQQHMRASHERLNTGDVSGGFNEQQGATQSLRQLRQALQRAGRAGGGRGMPLPFAYARGRSASAEKVEIPDEDLNVTPRAFRKDVMKAMKQGAPVRYRESNKKYYEELVK